MKKSFILSILAIATLLLPSCKKESSFDNNEDYPVFKGYMLFNTGVSTRTQLATSMMGKSFGVIGYEYNKTTDWGTAKPLQTPSTFYNQEIVCGDTGVCTYDVDDAEAGDQYKQWEDNHYAFFAYYPYDGDGIELSSETAVDTPTLTFTYPWLGENKIPAYMSSYNGIYDLMTAEDLNLDGSRNVNFSFKHRLFAVEVLANNYNETVYEYVYVYKTDPETGEFILDDQGNKIIATDENGNKIIATDAQGNKIIATDDEGNKIIAKDADGNLLDATTSVSNLSLTIEGLEYQSMTIPLSMREEEPKFIKREGPEITDEITFDIQNKGVKVPALNDPQYDETGKIIAGGGVATSISKNGTNNRNGYLMFIPQEEPITFSLLWTEIEPTQSIDRKITSTVQFEAGKLYQIVVNFIGSGITIALIEAGAWDDKTVYHKFE
ncbi:MAG: fimbrillin family protein [Alistipes sp.]|nr:fimbrillin family protein [Alistipes sp.]